MDTAMNNEPVAWMKEVESGTMYTNYEYPGSIPLYTHTAKTLTDEEIDSIGDEVSNLIDTYAGRREFARAILRKAQEK
jgi:hypothetical protein